MMGCTTLMERAWRHTKKINWHESEPNKGVLTSKEMDAYRPMIMFRALAMCKKRDIAQLTKKGLCPVCGIDWNTCTTDGDNGFPVCLHCLGEIKLPLEMDHVCDECHKFMHKICLQERMSEQKKKAQAEEIQQTANDRKRKKEETVEENRKVRQKQRDYMEKQHAKAAKLEPGTLVGIIPEKTEKSGSKMLNVVGVVVRYNVKTQTCTVATEFGMLGDKGKQRTFSKDQRVVFHPNAPCPRQELEPILQAVKDKTYEPKKEKMVSVAKALKFIAGIPDTPKGIGCCSCKNGCTHRCGCIRNKRPCASGCSCYLTNKPCTNPFT